MEEEEKKVEEVPAETKAKSEVERKGFNVTALILGIISIVSFYLWYIALPSGIIGIIFSVAGKNDAGRKMGIAGMILGIISLVLCFIVYVLVLLQVEPLASLIQL